MHRQALLRPRGMTLIEILVSLLILSASMALVSSAAFQVSKVLDAVQRNSAGEQLASFMLHHQVLDQALQHAAITRGQDPAEFAGQPDRLVWRTRQHPLGMEGGTEQAQLTIERDADGTWLLQLALATESLTVLRHASPFRLSYVDDALRDHDQWPVLGRELEEKLPRALVVRDESGVVLAQWVFHGPKRSHPFLLGDPSTFAGGSGATR